MDEWTNERMNGFNAFNGSMRCIDCSLNIDHLSHVFITRQKGVLL